MDINDKVVLMYVKDGTVYPVALTENQLTMLQFLSKALGEPLKVVFDQPQGTAVNLLDKGAK